MLILIIFKPKKIENFVHHCGASYFDQESCSIDLDCLWDSSGPLAVCRNRVEVGSETYNESSGTQTDICNNETLATCVSPNCMWDTRLLKCVSVNRSTGNGNPRGTASDCFGRPMEACIEPQCRWDTAYQECFNNGNNIGIAPGISTNTGNPTRPSQTMYGAPIGDAMRGNMPTSAATNYQQISSRIPNADQSDPTGRASDISRDNDFFIKNKNTDNVIMELDNIDDYYLENDPVVIGKKFKMIKFLDNSELRVYREDSDSEKDFTFGFYFKTFQTQIPKVFESFLELSNTNDSFQLNANLDMLNNKIVFVFSTNNISNTIQLSFNNSKILNYVIIQVKNDINNNVPKITFNLNNQLTTFKFITNNKIKVNNILFKNYEGYLGKVLVYNSIVDKEKLCRKFNCKLSCFRPDGTKTYGGNVNNCIKDCMKSCNDISKCQKICVDCEIEEEEWDNDTKLKMCPWLKDIKIFDKSPPDPPKIRGFPGDGKILIEWKKPFNGRGTINNYIIMVYETFNKKNGVQINIASNPTCDLCEHEIKNLKNQVYYDIIVKAVNNIGIGASSNIITIAPNGEKLKNDLNNIFYELDTDLENSISSEDIDMDCSNKTFNNVQNHSLDKKVPNLESFIRKN